MKGINKGMKNSGKGKMSGIGKKDKMAKGNMGKGGHASHESVMKKAGAMGMMSDKHMMDAESMAKMKKQMPKSMM